MLKWSCASLLLIALLHNLYLFFQKTLTVPKIKDLVHKPVARYEELLASTKTPALVTMASATAPATMTSFLPQTIPLTTQEAPLGQTMQIELNTFLKDLKTGALY
jgi:hypothetical protein